LRRTGEASIGKKEIAVITRGIVLAAAMLLSGCTTAGPSVGGGSPAANPVLEPAGKGWVPLLTSLDATKWTYESEFWKMEPDGALHGKYAGGNLHHFMYSTASYSNFELHADFKMTGYNSGICIRVEPTSFDNCPGYQVDMGDGYWGCLWEEKGRGMVSKFPDDQVKQVLHRGEWNHYYVLADGHHIVMYLNGTKTVDVVDTPGRLSGKIGFQLTHSQATDVQFRNMVIRPLP
jgi:hypothetical protein